MRLSNVPADLTSVSIAPSRALRNYILTFQFGGTQSMLSASKRAALTQDAPQAPFG